MRGLCDGRPNLPGAWPSTDMTNFAYELALCGGVSATGNPPYSIPPYSSQFDTACMPAGPSARNLSLRCTPRYETRTAWQTNENLAAELIYGATLQIEPAFCLAGATVALNSNGISNGGYCPKT